MDTEAIDAIANENIIPFSRTEIAEELRKISSELNVSFSCADLTWQNLDSDSWSIAFNVGEETETPSIMLHIRGNEPKTVFAALTADLNTLLIDCCTGEFISPDKPSSFEKWKRYRDQIVNGQ